MHPDAAQELIQYLDDCKAKGIEPKLPRMFYFGHELVGSFEPDGQIARWRCVICKHEWDAHDGWKCPKCGVIKNAPRWECKQCMVEWFGNDGKFCPKCGKPHDSENGGNKVDHSGPSAT